VTRPTLKAGAGKFGSLLLSLIDQSHMADLQFLPPGEPKVSAVMREL
jgi:hypothetical protein